MNVLPIAKRAAVVRSLVEGNSIRATARLVGTSKATVLKLLVELGEFCSTYQFYKLTNLPTKRVEVDEIWAFVGAKARNAKQEGHGDIWTFTALDADTKLMISWFVGERNSDDATIFLKDVQRRLSNRVQLTTDRHAMYRIAVPEAFHWKTVGVDYAQVVKEYGSDPDFENRHSHRRYSPAVCTGAHKERIFGDPDMDLVSTSYVERSNLTIRMGQGRFTRLTNAFSKKAENHAHSVSLFFMFYNFCRSHQSLTKERGGIRTTPAMASGLTDHVWTVEEILGLMDPKRLLQST
jgi:IS1 family transposase